MAITKDDLLSELSRVVLPNGQNLVSADMVRALSVSGGAVRFVIEAPTPDIAKNMGQVRDAAETLVRELDGVTSASVVLTSAHQSPNRAPAQTPPNLKVGRNPVTGSGPAKPAGVARVLAVGSGKGGVGKSTVSSNLAVALARQGRKVGLLDGDIHGPSLPTMLGLTERPTSPDGTRLTPLVRHGVTAMSIGLMLEADKAVIWRGPMLMGALTQMLELVDWGHLDVLIVDLPPGTGDVQLSLCQKTDVDGAIIVSTPQDVALMDARKAMSMFKTLETPILGLIENMSYHVCPQCGHESHIFGSGGVKEEANKLGFPFMGAIPLNLEVRQASDAGEPIAASDSEIGEIFARFARDLIERDLA